MNHIPLSNLDHPVCEYAMACRICMERCYDGIPGHILLDGKPTCECGRYSREDPIWKQQGRTGGSKPHTPLT